MADADLIDRLRGMARHELSELLERIDCPPAEPTIRELLAAILQGQQDIMTALSDLQAAVNAEETQEAAVLTYLAGLPALIAAAGNDSAQLNALTAQITADTAKLKAGVDLAPSEGGGTPPATGAFTVTPTTASIPVGSSLPVPVSITGATGAVTAAGLPSGVTFNGTSLVPDGTQAAGSSSVTFGDAASNTATLALTVA